MRPTFRLGEISGISIGLHWSIALIAAVLTASLTGTILPAFAPGYGTATYLVAALTTSALFLASIVAHEMGHSLVAVNNRIRVRGVTLFALGGVATLDGEPTNPGAAARIALAGPGVSLAIGGVSLGAAVAAGGLGLPVLVGASLLWLGLINLSLAVFNMLPALPLDGGRVLQAFLWHRRGDRHGATISAAGVGRFMGWVLVLFGVWELSRGGNGLWTALIGWFVIVSARSEAMRARVQRQQEQGQGQAPFPFPFPFQQPSPAWAPPSSWTPPRAQDRFGQAPPTWPPTRPPTRPSDQPSNAPRGQGDVIDVDGHRVDDRH